MKLRCFSCGVFGKPITQPFIQGVTRQKLAIHTGSLHRSRTRLTSQPTSNRPYHHQSLFSNIIPYAYGTSTIDIVEYMTRKHHSACYTTPQHCIVHITLRWLIRRISSRYPKITHLSPISTLPCIGITE